MIRQMIDERASSKRGEQYTGANRASMRQCPNRLVPDMQARFDGACAERMEASMNVLDELFDKYFPRCVQ